MIKHYMFDGSNDKNAYETLRRLADEVGWIVEVDDAAAERLRQSKADFSVSRAHMTRQQFAESICAGAGAKAVRFYRP